MKFFIPWLIDTIKEQARWFVVTGLLAIFAYGANEGYHYYFPKARMTSSAEEEETAKAQGSRGIASVERSVGTNDASDTHEKTNSGTDSPQQNPLGSGSTTAGGNTNSNASANAKDSGNSNVSRAGTGYSPITSGGQTAGAAPVKPATLQGENANSPVQNDIIGGSLPSSGAGSPPYTAPGNGGTDVSQTSVAFNFQSTAGFQFLSGGQISTGTNMQVHVSIGSPTSQGIQTGTGMMFTGGVEGVNYGR
jgi:hypothetical protein